MNIKPACILAIALLTASPLFAEESKPVEGVALIGGKTFQFKYAVAYETKESDETLISVLASDRKIPIAEIKKALAENDGNDRSLLLGQPYVRVTFKDGKPTYAMGAGTNSNFGESGEKIIGELKVADGVATGVASLEKNEEGPFQRAFALKFSIPFGLDTKPTAPTTPAAPPKPTVTGTYKANGKAAKLAYVSARPGEPFADKPSILLVFTEKDHSKDSRPDINASFGRYGNALIISTHEDGSIFGCQVAHSAHSKSGFSSVGKIHTVEFDVTEVGVSGKISTDGEQDAFGETWEVDISFAAPMKKAAAKVAVAEPKPSTTTQSPKIPSIPKAPRGKPAMKAEPKPAAAQASLAVGDLPFLKDATDVQYQKLVGMMTFKSSTGVSALAGQMQKDLSAKGWKSDGSELVTAASAILHRTSGDAELTIIIQPSGKGSEVRVMSEGLDWSKVE